MAKALGHTSYFFYRGTVKDTTRLYLEQLCKQIKYDLGVNEYDYHWVDFYGTSNYGSDLCWLALFPINKYSHREAYQIFIRFAAFPQAGMIAGDSLKNAEPNQLNSVNSYTEAIQSLEVLKPRILKLNRDSKNYFKFSPSTQASEWTKFYGENIAAIGYNGFDLGDISIYNSIEELNVAVGLPSDSRSNQTWNLWLFKTANIGDVIFINKGVNTCIGIGIIDGPYYFDETAIDYRHKRKVRWITDKTYLYSPGTLKGYKTLFRPDTFSPTKVYDFILQEYIRTYPELLDIFKKNGLYADGIEEPIAGDESTSTTGKQVQPVGSQFVRFWKPLLIVLQEIGGSGTPVQIRPLVALKLGISEDEVNVKLKSGTSRIYNQIDWARNSLKDLGFISADTRGLWKLTEKGLKAIPSDLDVYGSDTIDENETEKELRFWWLNANPQVWDVSSFKVGDKQTYTTHNSKNNKRRIYKYFEAIKPDDLIIGYESTPTKQIKAKYRVTKGLHITPNGEEIEFELTEKLEIPLHWKDLKNNPGLQDCEVFKNNQGSLFKLTEEEYDIICEMVDEKNIAIEELIQSSNIINYNFLEDEDKPFISEKAFKDTVAMLKRKKNIILQGPPGVGKTFIARKLAYEIMQKKNDADIEMVQFHQSYSYEDFVQGLRPTQKGGFELRDGIFHSFCQRALAHPERPFFFIIDEINRGNLSKILGELMMLIEADKRNKKFAIKLTYAEDEEDRFYVPENLFIIGTMNTADRSLAIVDYALRRRFAFIPLEPDYGDNFQGFLASIGLSQMLISHICMQISNLNHKIRVDPNLGEGFQIGHSYFCLYQSEQDENVWWEEIVNFEIKPLLEEIWFDEISKVRDSINLLSR